MFTSKYNKSEESNLELKKIDKYGKEIQKNEQKLPYKNADKIQDEERQIFKDNVRLEREVISNLKIINPHNYHLMISNAAYCNNIKKVSYKKNK